LCVILAYRARHEINILQTYPRIYLFRYTATGSTNFFR